MNREFQKNVELATILYEFAEKIVDPKHTLEDRCTLITDVYELGFWEGYHTAKHPRKDTTAAVEQIKRTTLNG